MKFLNIKNLNLPKDVIENSGECIELFGELTGNSDEIVVITQLRRTVYNAYVCHVSYDCKTEYLIGHKIINDIPEFPIMIIKGLTEDICIKTINGVKYTMVCKADKHEDFTTPNWL